MDEQKPILHYHHPRVSRRALAVAIIVSALIAHILGSYGTAFVCFLIYRVPRAERCSRRRPADVRKCAGVASH